MRLQQSEGSHYTRIVGELPVELVVDQLSYAVVLYPHMVEQDDEFDITV